MQAPRFFVHIVESPSGVDLLEGRAEGRALTAVLDLAGVPHTYQQAVDVAHFDKALGARLESAIKRWKAPPVLHFSAHGSKDGLGLSSGAVVDWQQLAQRLLPINKALDGQLIVCLSACHGLRATNALLGSDALEPACKLIVGCTEEAPWSDSLVAFVAFYHVYRKTGEFEASLKAMKAAVHNNNFFGVAKSREDLVP